MTELVVHGWKIGFQKVSMTKLLREEFGYSLSEAKAITDSILENKQVRLPCPNLPEEVTLARLRALGVDASLEGSS